jgi:hypothetical protein
MHKNDGGMGFKNLPALNFAMLGKQPNLLISKLFKARYFLHCDFLTSKLGHNRSFVWRSIFNSKIYSKSWY